jgi:predicted metal-dependent hydrolase
MLSRRYMKEIDGLGPILFEKSYRAKRMNISVRPFAGVRIAVPKLVPFSEAENLAKSRAAWIIKQKSKMAVIENEMRQIAKDEIDINLEDTVAKLGARLNELALKHKLFFNRVTFRNQTTRWGSCSPKNHISLNLKLIMLPDHLIDYVLLHELVHTKIKNHGSKFWLALDKLTGNAKALDKELKGYRIGRNPDNIPLK